MKGLTFSKPMQYQAEATNIFLSILLFGYTSLGQSPTSNTVIPGCRWIKMHAMAPRAIRSIRVALWMAPPFAGLYRQAVRSYVCLLYGYGKVWQWYDKFVANPMPTFIFDTSACVRFRIIRLGWCFFFFSPFRCFFFFDLIFVSMYISRLKWLPINEASQNQVKLHTTRPARIFFVSVQKPLRRWMRRTRIILECYKRKKRQPKFSYWLLLVGHAMPAYEWIR